MAEVAVHCPKCHAVMVILHRDGFMIEQCAVCRGGFLSEPELGRLFEAAGHLGPPLPPVHNGHPRHPYEGRHRRG